MERTIQRGGIVHGMADRPAGLDGADNAERTGNRTWYRQYNLHFHTGRQATGPSTGKARLVGLGLAMFIRIALLFSLTWLMGLTSPLFTVLGNEISGRDLILISGGLFLLWKSTMEIHEKLEGEQEISAARVGTTFGSVIVQILLLDIVFSLDSIITALGMASQLAVMVAAVVIAVGFMMLFSGKSVPLLKSTQQSKCWRSAFCC